MWGRFPLTKVIIRVLEIAGAGLTSAVVAYLLGRTEPPPPTPAPAVVQLAPSDQEMIRTVHSDQAALLDQLRGEADARKKMQVASQATPQQPAPQVAAPEAPPQQTALQATMPQAAAPQAATSQAVTPQAAPQQATTPQPVLTNDVAVSATDLAVASAPVAKPEKSVQASTRREQKPERVRVVDAKPEAKSESNKTEANKAEAKPRLKVAPRADEVSHSRPMPGVVVEAVARNASQREVVAAPVLVAPPPPPVASAPPPESDGVLSSTLRGITAWILPSRDRVPTPDQNATRPPRAVGEFQQSSM